MIVPFNDLQRGYNLFQAEYESKALEILRSGWYILGQEVKCFENEFSEANEVKYCVGVDNGLNALTLSLLALGIETGDEVIVQSNTYIATVLAVTHNHAIPVFVEPDKYYNIDVNRIEEKITSKTKAILVTHLYGQASQMERIVELCDKYKLFLVEDCAQAHFAQYNNQNVGTFGQIGCFSFYPTKNLGGFGDGGAVLTNNEVLATKIATLRNYGSNKKYNNEIEGFNSRLDELQAGLLRIKLKHFNDLKRNRIKIAERYLQGIDNSIVYLPNVRKGSTSIWHLFVVRVENRKRFRKYLQDYGITTEIHYPIPPYLSDAYMYLQYQTGDYPLAEEYANTVVSLPIFDGMTLAEVDYVINIINQFRG
ncbi:DegT/DnrJ/EryC1/StrS family aminotransferase [Sinanaerobacter chloroacetimidivorans]|uniref:DegT/DnrJ/EryC1/StrS family aminotransferase n=1 Tax=Sinanaerobacter chloroacetimidivorans TaxID=2818044 RepID=A0A8J7W546_9FIRM|nr:DegT/DnrJ/EryC1/StrS family aminotransferase [Sinanaerobacter chloroacetimidivorans]MBR0599533.1 DegT/DnrJ/EryC1/StrS family aminotransferase [Sinanaerobacter chloroacetimidivorans]